MRLATVFAGTLRSMREDSARLDPWLQADRGGGRRMKLVSPVLWETWLSPPTSTQKAVVASQLEWRRVQVSIEPDFGRFHSLSRPVITIYQPVSASYIRACHSSRAARESVPAVGISDSAAPADSSTCPLPDNSQSSSTDSPARSISRPRPRFALPLFSAAPDMTTEEVKIAVMISMPYSACRNDGEGPSCPKSTSNDALREYQIGVVQVPWTSSA